MAQTTFSLGQPDPKDSAQYWRRLGVQVTFNPGWDQNIQGLDAFEDARNIQKRLKAEGFEFLSKADETTTGPANFMITDPDGNHILVDQHR